MSLTENDVFKILKIIEESHFDEIRVEVGDLKIHVRRGGGTLEDGSLEKPLSHPVGEPQTPVQTPIQAPAAAAEARENRAPEPTGFDANLVAIRAPMLGTFYRSASPGAPPFVEEGAAVEPDETVCLIEVMKLFNSVKAGVRGRVAKILVENGSLVEFEQALMLIEPSGNGEKESIQ